MKVTNEFNYVENKAENFWNLGLGEELLDS